mgnify:CR=1 FL=1
MQIQRFHLHRLFSCTRKRNSGMDWSLTLVDPEGDLSPFKELVGIGLNALSSDKVLQQMYRCMTEGENKKIGFVVDLNISRVLNTCVNYTVHKNEKSIDDKMKYLIKNHLINIDVDMMLNKKINSDMIVKKLMDIWKEDPINSFRTLLRKLDNDYEEFDNSTQKLINKTFTKSLKDDKISLKLKT